VPNSWYSVLLANHPTQQASSRILMLKIWWNILFLVSKYDHFFKYNWL